MNQTFDYAEIELLDPASRIAIGVYSITWDYPAKCYWLCCGGFRQYYEYADAAQFEQSIKDFLRQHGYILRNSKDGMRDYLASLVREIKNRAIDYHLPTGQFVFRMSQSLWDDLSRFLELQPDRKNLLVDGVEVPVDTSEEIPKDTVWFVYDDETLRRLYGEENDEL